MLIAAFTSRSWVTPHPHVHVRMFSGSFSWSFPQVEHSLEEGKNRSMANSSRPYQLALYSNMVRNSAQDASEIARASLLFLTRLRTERSSITTTWFSRTSRVDSLCRQSFLRSVMRACARATFLRALANFARSRRSWQGLATFWPVDRLTSEVIPASTPTTRSVGAWWVMVSWHRIDTNQRPALSRETVTVEGTAPSGRGRDHTMSSGELIFASVSCPLRYLKPDRECSADALDFLRDLNRGYSVRPAKKFRNAVCKWRSPCWRGTEETSLRKARSSSFFHSVSIAEVAL